jgi:uncharacterized protein (TIGR02300 family)
MPAKDLGTKHLCFKCGTKFYDLRKPEPICPKCGADQRQSPALKPAPEKRSRAPARPAAPAAVVPDEADTETADLEEDAEADEADEDDDEDDQE